MLTKSEVEFIEARKGRNGTMTTGEKQRSYRIRKKALKTIENLAYLAGNLPEKQMQSDFY